MKKVVYSESTTSSLPDAEYKKMLWACFDVLFAKSNKRKKTNPVDQKFAKQDKV